MKKIPAHLITGFLGSGKSTLIHSLIENKPVDERWAVLVNEFGQIGIDQAMFTERDDVIVKGLPGGCLCCQLAFVMQATLVNLLHRHRPDRLIIEPSGLGHPAGLLDMLRGEAFAEVLDVQDIIATLDPRRLDEQRVREHETFRDQLEMADAVVLTMTDQASIAQQQAARERVESYWPPKKWLVEAPHGALPIDLLLKSGQLKSEPLKNRHAATAAAPSRPASHQALHVPAAPAMLDDVFAAVVDRPPPLGKPQHETGSALGYTSLSWRWHPEKCFDLDQLTAQLSALPREVRVKGILHTQDGWKLLNRAEGAMHMQNSAWRQDSRLEIIAPPQALPSADSLASGFKACRDHNDSSGSGGANK
ncbi:GTP-binding protein [Vreelandella rituensis]|uniref:CobW family GTP-binding protein n=1 Tax=Vreelandella rituensis TaxID=2282306 RepID=UPI001F2DF47D|nr:GTP-binding protein [Halomonas rituensis]